MTNKICFSCDKEIIIKYVAGQSTGDRYKMIPVDKTNSNLFFHVDCFKKIDNLKEYLNIPGNLLKIKTLTAVKPR